MFTQHNWNQARALIEKIPVGVLMVDESGQIQGMNQAARFLFSNTINVLSDLPEKTGYRLYSPVGVPLQAEERPLVLALRGETVTNYEVLLRDQLGREYFLMVDASPIYPPPPAGQRLIQGAIAIFQDITARRQGEEKVRASEERARLLASLSRAFAETGNEYPAILAVIARSVAQAAGEGCLIHLLSEEGAYLRMVAAHLLAGPADLLDWFAAFPCPVDAYPNGLVLNANQSMWIQDPGQDAELLARLPQAFQDWIAALPGPAVLIAPLRAAGRPLGTICLWRSSRHPAWQPEDFDLFQDLADRAALAIENARLYSEEVQRNRELNALHDATKALLSTLDLEMLLGRILDAAQRALPAAERSLLFLVAPRTGRLEVRASLGFSDPRIRRMGQIHNSIAVRAMREMRPLVIDDVFSEPRQGEGAGQNDETMRSAIFAPLLLGTDVLGVLSLSSSRLAAFTTADLRLLVSFAVTTTAALHNAMLHAEMQKIAITDALTGLYNRRGLLELGRHEIDRFLRFGYPLAAIMADIDFFKKVNDSYGHKAGDQVLGTLAERCRTAIRLVDIIGRYGGEEFAVILPETDLFQASNIAERLRRVVEEEPFLTEAGPISITISLGVTRAGRDLEGLSVLLEQADAALYLAKLKGRNRVELG